MLTDTACAASPDDQDLLAMIVAGKQSGLDELYARHASAVFACACRVCRDPFLADEVTQDVFLQAWRTAHRYNANRGAVKTWLFVIARTRALDRLRASRRHTYRNGCVEGSVGRDGTQPDPPGVTTDEPRWQSQLETLLAILPPEDRQLIDLSFFEGLSHTEIARRLAQPLGTVKTRVRRILRLLHSALAARQARSVCVDWMDRSTSGRAEVLPESAPRGGGG